jgi:hypothetical protein
MMRTSTIAMNLELSLKFAMRDQKTVTVYVKRFHTKNTFCSSLQLHCRKMTIEASAPIVAESEKKVV